MGPVNKVVERRQIRRAADAALTFRTNTAKLVLVVLGLGAAVTSLVVLL